jgi:mevalonate kinase
MHKYYAPGVIKLLGEHAVVYGKLSLAAAISLYASASFEKLRNGYFELYLKDFGKSIKVDPSYFEALAKEYKGKQGFEEYYIGKDAKALPYLTIASLLAQKNSLAGIKLSISSEIPVQKGYASSAACSTAFAIAICEALGLQMNEHELVELAREGDKVIHKNEGAGKIDVNTSFYGGIVSYSSERGARKEDIDVELKLYVIDTGPKKSTAETVAHVRELYEKERERVEKIFDEIDKLSRFGIELLEKGDKKGFGELMYRNHELLKALGVSSEKLDLAVDAAKKNRLFGAKLSGGGGGGIAIILADDDAEIKVFSDLGFEVKKVSIDYEGAKS